MLQKKDVVTVVILSIVTCGIYQYVWFWKTINALYDRGKSSVGELQPIVQFLLLFVPYVGAIFFGMNADANINIIRRDKGMCEIDNKVLWVVLSIFFPIVITALVQSAINEVADF